MADNIAIRDATGTSRTVACDEVTIDGAVAEVQRVKVVHGVAGAAVDASATNPLPVIPTDLVLGDSGRKTSTSVGTAVALAASTAAKFVRVTALLTNTQQINVGGASALAVAGSTAGDPLLPGDSCTFVVTNLTQVFLDVRVSGEGVSYTYWT